MNRRDWLKLCLVGAAGLTLDVERLLWVPRAIVTVPAMPTQRTLLEWARRMSGHDAGSVDAIVELLVQTNAILEDPRWAHRRANQ